MSARSTTSPEPILTSISDDAEIHWVIIRAVLASVADVAIVPLQDVLGLGNEARMNLPGSSVETGIGVIVRAR